MENELSSHRSGAMEQICILGAQEGKHRDKQTVPTSIQTAHTPTAPHSTSGHDHPGEKTKAWHQALLTALLLRQIHRTDFAPITCQTKWAALGYICPVHLEH